MKLRNKKTGKIVDLSEGLIRDAYGGECIQIRPVAALKDGYQYDSLGKLIEEWEDYEQKGPLIKDEKIRKAIRAWANIQGHPITKVLVHYYEESDGFFNYQLYGYTGELTPNGELVTNENSIAIFFEFISLEKIEFDKKGEYTIDELCGDNE